jgi:RNA polymerase sigma factor (sigma-70 family)
MKGDRSSEDLGLFLQQGDLRALELLYQKYNTDLFFYALKVTNNRALAEDAVQDTFVDIWNHRHQMGKVRSLQFYLIRSVRHRCLKLVKKNNRFRFLDATSEVDISIEPEELRLTDYSLEVKSKVGKALQLLSDRQREIVYLKFYENLEYQEIAELLALNYQSVVNHVHRAIVKLRTADILKYLEY